MQDGCRGASYLALVRASINQYILRNCIKSFSTQTLSKACGRNILMAGPFVKNGLEGHLNLCGRHFQEE